MKALRAFFMDYDSLVGDLVAWTEDDNPSFMAQLDRIIALGSEKVARDLDLEVLDEVRGHFITKGDPVIEKPRRTRVTRSFHIEQSGVFTPIESRSYDFVLGYQEGASGAPRYWCDLDADHWMVGPVPDDGYVCRTRAIAAPAIVSPSNRETWISRHVPDALFYACLMACEEFIKADDRIAVWRGTYNAEVIPAARKQLAPLLRDPEQPPQPEGR
ncbi:hypothetical protein [Salinisphaera hydrothermalis]|uniref:Uncharacterized protein n=1 Tax=Salinisphaera hydrothermalis (strain C41B8) TaxID=1304275 RepID=A0A084INM3_SALHC|nr:hypothetical protein [Salinisphaera hydrothermalis]KEZ78307.1 hypothetical protein C41B8_05378 [Salinisphaera hydrothermalis C41B8]